MRRPAGRAATVAVVAALAATTSGVAYGASLLLNADGLGALAVKDVAIPKFTPSLTGASVPTSITSGQTVASQATISGATTSATGTITHELFSGTTCSGAAFGMQTTSVTGNGSKTSGTLSPTAVGTYSWRLSYDGDPRNSSISGTCGNGGTVTVTAAASAALAFTSCTTNTGSAACPTPGPATVTINKSNQNPAGTWTAKVSLVNSAGAVTVNNTGSAITVTLTKTNGQTSITYSSGTSLTIPNGASESSNSFTFSNAAAPNGDGSDVVRATTTGRTGQANVSW